MVKLISAILSLSMLFGTGAAPASAAEVTANVPVTVGAQQAVYEKWAAKAHKEDRYRLDFVSQSSSDNGSATTWGYTKYSLDEKTGAITFSDEISSDQMQIGTVIWADQVRGVIKKVVSRPSSEGGWSTYRYYYDKYLYSTDVYEKDSYLSDVTSVNGSLPADGRHSDGYWYVFKNLVED